MQLQGHIYSNSNLNSAIPIRTNTAQNNEQDKINGSQATTGAVIKKYKPKVTTMQQ